ncbi:MAG: hypothetical protein HKN72_12780 [Gemmatimonadetes bacterium]|nr:hypothetical protein [Gemmatimonadota bacterium]
MRFPHSVFPTLLLGALVSGCDSPAPTAPGSTLQNGPSFSVEAADARCTLSVHAILREAGSVATIGQVQFRIYPPDPGATDATVRYRGVFGPTSGLDFHTVSVGLESRVPAQTPTWTDVEKSDPGAPSSSIVKFGRTAPMSQEMAMALVDDASRFKAVINVVAASGGREAEGLVAPRRRVPESVRERQRLCFDGG